MLVTLTDPIKVPVTTDTAKRGQTHPQIVNINITTHTRNMMGRTYWQLLTDPDITQLDTFTPPLRCSQAKGIIGKQSDEMTWATTLYAHPDVISSVV
jgi:hypothetical protein